MNAGPTRYAARMVAGGNWRVWDRDRNQWVTDLLPSYPDELLRDLNGPASVPTIHEQPSDEGPTERLIRVAYLTASGAVLGGPLAVWLLLPGPPGPGEAGCGLEVLGAFLFGPLVGAIVGGLLGLTAGLLFNSLVGWVSGAERNATHRSAVD